MLRMLKRKKQYT